MHAWPTFCDSAHQGCHRWPGVNDYGAPVGTITARRGHIYHALVPLRKGKKRQTGKVILFRVQEQVK
jgi:hypothetical protein